MEYWKIKNILFELKKSDLCHLISDLMMADKIDITDINSIYVSRLKKKIEEKDKIIFEADNCIFNSLAYDSIKKLNSRDAILEKVKWRYKYANCNKENLCKIFDYDPEENEKKN